MIDIEEKIREGKIVEELNHDYHAHREYISKSRLIKIGVCPEYFKWCEENEQERTEAMVVGSAFHKIVLEPDTFDDEFAVIPAIDRRTKDGKLAYEEFVKNAAGKSLITEEQFNTISAMRDVIMANKYAKALLKGTTEKSIYFEDELTGEKCKCRPDCMRVIKDRVVITDLKSCSSAENKAFVNDVLKFGYDVQAYMYRLGVSKALDIPPENVDFVFIAVEKKEPYLMNILQVDEYTLQRGEQLFRKYIGTYHECKETDNWYGLNGIYGEINQIVLPNYILENIKTGE